MAKSPVSEPAWKAWVAPGIILAVLGYIGVQIDGVGDRITKLDEKIDGQVGRTNDRIDKVLAAQTEIARSLGKIESSTAYMRQRVDKIADKLDVASIPGKAMFVKMLKANPVEALKNAGFSVYGAGDSGWKLNPPDPKLGLKYQEMYFFNPKQQANKPK